MHLEDACLYLILDDATPAPETFCAAAIAGGADVIQLSAPLAAKPDVREAVREVCRRDDALLIVADDAAAAVDGKADGLHLSTASASVGQARAVVGLDGIVGISTHSSSDALLGIEVGVDYLLHWAGTLCPGVFAGLPGATGLPLYAAGVESLEDARTIVERGVYRLCIEAARLGGGEDVAEQVAAYSRVLGRSI